ncbi:hypothetical protein QTO34_004775 [Cnephaeus nilssonii]|uniref:Uncharacterized protein n=1 Tax=Cnephaeus nilssonii TaxID=3371016 RepID=A0AA40LIW1_CNENI|nr:hypothetical protein QTO34_004775 [Eptesicus nilssonii]
MEGQKRRKEVPAMPETLKKKQRNLAELNIKHLGNNLPKSCFQRQGGRLLCKKLALASVAQLVGASSGTLKAPQGFSEHAEDWETMYYMGYSEPEVSKLFISKHGYGKINKKRIAPKNTLIARSFGKYRVICMEKLTREICTVGKCFKEADSFLWPFNYLPRARIEKTTRFVEGGNADNREDQLNRLIRRMD